MLLENKNTIIYGAGGAIGGAVARAFAREGATVFLAGRTQAKLDKVAEEISAAGGVAETAQVDALDERAVDRHADAVATQAGSIDVSFNAVGIDNGEQGIPLVELSADDYLIPITAYARTHFVTAKAAARHMMKQGSGVILPLSQPMARMPVASTGVFGTAFAAVECLPDSWRRSWGRTASVSSVCGPVASRRPQHGLVPRVSCESRSGS